MGLARFSFERPISGLPSWGLVVVDGSTAFRLPGGGSLSVATERNQRAPRDLVPGPPLGQTPHTLLSLRGYWKIPCGGYTPSGYAYGAAAKRRGMERNRVSISPWPAGHCPKGSFPPAGGNTEYGQLSGGRKRPVERRWEWRAKVSSSPPPPEPIRRGRTRNR